MRFAKKIYENKSISANNFEVRSNMNIMNQMSCDKILYLLNACYENILNLKKKIQIVSQRKKEKNKSKYK